MAGEIVLITGAGHGIGRQTAYEFAKRKSRLVLWDINKVLDSFTHLLKLQVRQVFKNLSDLTFAYICIFLSQSLVTKFPGALLYICIRMGFLLLVLFKVQVPYYPSHLVAESKLEEDYGHGTQ